MQLVDNISQATYRRKLVMQTGAFNIEFPYAGDLGARGRVFNQYELYIKSEELVCEKVYPNHFGNLLSKGYFSFFQLNRKIELLTDLVKSLDISLLQLHWIIHFFLQLGPFVRETAARQLRTALKLWWDLHLGISKLAYIVVSPLWKFKFTPARSTIHTSFRCIYLLKGGQA